MTEKTLSQRLPVGAARNKVEFLADEFEKTAADLYTLISGLGGGKPELIVDIGSKFPDPMTAKEGELFQLVSSYAWRHGFVAEHVRKSDNVMIASTTNSRELAVSLDYGKSFQYKQLPVSFSLPPNFFSKGQGLQMGINPASNGKPLIVHGTGEDIHISRDLGSTWQDIASQLKSVTCSKTGVIFNALGLNPDSPNELPKYSFSVDGDIVLFCSQQLDNKRGFAVSFDGGDTFTGIIGSTGNVDDFNFATESGATFAYECVVCADASAPFAMFVGGWQPLIRLDLSNSDNITFTAIEGTQPVGDFHCSLAFDNATKKAYLFDHNSERRYTVIDSTGGLTKHDFPVNPSYVWAVTRWQFGGALLSNTSQLYVSNGVFIFGRPSNGYEWTGTPTPIDDTAQVEICALNLATNELTVLHSYTPTVKQSGNHIVDVGQISYQGDHIFITHNGVTLRSTDNGNTWVQPEGETIGLFININHTWKPTTPINDAIIPLDEYGDKLWPITLAAGF